MNSEKRFYEQFKLKVDLFVHNVYKIAKHFPKEEIYGLTSQLRRAALSVALNYIEGYARLNVKVEKNFLLISFGSLKESQYLIEFSFKEGYLTENNYKILAKQADEIAALLWTSIKRLT